MLDSDEYPSVTRSSVQKLKADWISKTDAMKAAQALGLAGTAPASRQVIVVDEVREVV